ncbi:hypothetical protein [uncultured Pseudoteredinibacter sp.]|uniref:hypothetical protein n=1 Tax=uncultured Pseudoteredinibacter sp. TaxID=1641701 RepID=UPI002621E668|nr:hypothetical protein [uncultured Pseudoteredinibacter sp.]
MNTLEAKKPLVLDMHDKHSEELRELLPEEISFPSGGGTCGTTIVYSDGTVETQSGDEDGEGDDTTIGGGGLPFNGGI